MNQKDTLLKVFKYTGKYKMFLILSIILSIVSVALTLYIPILTGDAIDLIVAKGKVDFVGLLPIIKYMVFCFLFFF